MSAIGKERFTRQATKKTHGQTTKTTGYPKGKLARKVVSNTALIVVKLILRALRHPKVFFTLPFDTSLQNRRFMSAFQAVSIHEEHSGVNYTGMVYQ